MRTLILSQWRERRMGVITELRSFDDSTSKREIFAPDGMRRPSLTKLSRAIEETPTILLASDEAYSLADGLLKSLGKGVP